MSSTTAGSSSSFVADDAGPLLPWLSRRVRRLAAHRTAVDSVAALLLLLVLTGALRFSAEDRWWVYAVSGVFTLPLALRRRTPLAVFWCVLCGAVVLLVFGAANAPGFGVLLALYTVAAHEPRRRAILATCVLEAETLVSAFVVAPHDGNRVATIIFTSGLVTSALFIGTTLRNRRAYLAALEDRALRLEREREHLSRLAVTAERTRIAREMHDVVVHGLSVMIALADGAVVVGRAGPKEATDAMRLVSATGRSSMDEMRRLLGVLRDDDTSADLSPAPTLARLDTLVDAVRSAGLPVALRVTGHPQEVPPTAEATVYRIVQEALTNAMRHAVEPTGVEVSMRWAPECLRVDVVDDGRPAPAVDASEGGGHGLAGMRERIALFGGTVSAGAAAGGGWRVAVVLPVATS